MHVNYDDIAQAYAIQRNASERVVSHIVRAVKDAQPHDILEVGCGTADHLFVLARALGASGYGFDRSAAMLEEGARKNPGLHLRQGDAAVQYPFPATWFDLVFSVNVIHYISDLEQFFREARRVLRPGGMVVTVTDSWDDIRNRTMSLYFPESVEIELKRYPPVEAIEKAMNAAEFLDTWLSHTGHTYVMDESHLAQFRSKAFSALWLISEAGYQQGIARLKRDVQRGDCTGRELYTYVWGRKP